MGAGWSSAFTNPLGNLGRNERVEAVMPHDGKRPLENPFPHFRVHGKAVDLVAVDEVEEVLALDARDPVLFDDLADLGAARLALGFLALHPVEFGIASGLGRHGTLRLGLLVRWRRQLLLFLAVLLLFVLKLGLLHLLLGDEAGCEKLFAQ